MKQIISVKHVVIILALLFLPLFFFVPSGYAEITNLNKDTKYNTYKYNGLPVGPISSISTGIIKNVLNYKESEYYYFFATQDGKVLYAKTYQEHQANVNSNKWY